jgi:hypothetical protein
MGIQFNLFQFSLVVTLASQILFGFAPQDQQIDPDPQPRWWKGNLHTHSLWSDGNDFLK